jgi:argininosuccinate synthase
MTTRLVVACFGDLGSLTAIAAAKQRAATDVVAVAFDLGAGESLGGMKEAALAAGAARCHALDVREEFAREVVLPAARDAGTAGANQNRTFAMLAAAFVDRALQSIAALEEGRAMLPVAIPSNRGVEARGQTLAPARMGIGFESGIPVAINGIHMTLTELLESIETISGRSALEILSAAYRELGGAASRLEGRESTQVTFEIGEGCCTIATAAAVR